MFYFMLIKILHNYRMKELLDHAGLFIPIKGVFESFNKWPGIEMKFSLSFRAADVAITTE